MPYSNTHKNRKSYSRSTLTFIGPAKRFPQPDKNGKFLRFFIIIIREYGSTLYVGLARAVPPTNTNFQPLLLPTQAGMPYISTEHHSPSLHSHGPAKRWKCLSAAHQKRQILAILHHHNNNNKILSSYQFILDSSTIHVQMFTTFISIGSY